MAPAGDGVGLEAESPGCVEGPGVACSGVESGRGPVAGVPNSGPTNIRDADAAEAVADPEGEVGRGRGVTVGRSAATSASSVCWLKV